MVTIDLAAGFSFCATDQHPVSLEKLSNIPWPSSRGRRQGCARAQQQRLGLPPRYRSRTDRPHHRLLGRPWGSELRQQPRDRRWCSSWKHRPGGCRTRTRMRRRGGTNGRLVWLVSSRSEGCTAHFHTMRVLLDSGLLVNSLEGHDIGLGWRVSVPNQCWSTTVCWQSRRDRRRSEVLWKAVGGKHLAVS